jgi:hypothetical protein
LFKKAELALWIGRKLVEPPRKKGGAPLPPAAGKAIRIQETTGQELTCVARGDGFDLFIGKKPEHYRFGLTVSAVLELTRWIIWWWVRYTWCGLKLKLWAWVVRTRMGADR